MLYRYIGCIHSYCCYVHNISKKYSLTFSSIISPLAKSVPSLKKAFAFFSSLLLGWRRFCPCLGSHFQELQLESQFGQNKTIFNFLVK